MADTGWTARYAAQTAGGYVWRCANAISTLVEGEIYNGGWQAARWVVRADGTLHCPENRAHNVAMVTAPAPTTRDVTTPSRALDADFVVHATRDAHVFYTVELSASVLLSGTQSAAVDLIVGGAVVASAKNLLMMTIALGVTETVTHQKVVSALVPAGSTVRLSSTATSGGSATLMGTVEVLL